MACGRRYCCATSVGLLGFEFSSSKSPVQDNRNKAAFKIIVLAYILFIAAEVKI
jgi:hypothetical protein